MDFRIIDFCRKITICSCIERLRLYYILKRNHKLIHSINDTRELIEELFRNNSLLFMSKYSLIQIQNLYYQIVQVFPEYNCFDYSILFAQIYRNKRNGVKLIFGVYKNNHDLVGHSWVEIGKNRNVDFTGAYIYCTKTKEYEIT